VLSLLLDVDIIINLFFVFSKKLPLIDALIMTGITTALLYVYITYKNKKSSSES